jgi:hypothetical protein
MKNRKYYRSYSEAMKKLNLIVAETNRITGNDFEIPLIGEQPEVKKKFVLKTAKKAEPAPDMAAPAPEVPAPDMSSPAPDMGAPAPEMGGDTDMGMAPEMGGDTDMGMAPEMGGEETPEMPMAPGDAPMLDTEVDVEDEEEGGPSTLKLIQKLTGKLSQKLRTFDKDKGLDSQDIKYVMNSIISAINLSKLDDDDREDIVDKLEGFDGYGEDEGELDLQGDEELNFGLDAETAPEGTEEVDFEETEMMPEPETKEGYQTVMDSIFGESKIEKVLSNYFQIKDEEKPIIENKNKMDYLKNKIVKITQKEEVSRLSVSESQTKKSLVLLEEYSDSKLLGKTNKNNLVFRINGREVKVTPNGQTL